MVPNARIVHGAIISDLHVSGASTCVVFDRTKHFGSTKTRCYFPRITVANDALVVHVAIPLDSSLSGTSACVVFDDAL